jgi:plasmid stabilization system protein ParE
VSYLLHPEAALEHEKQVAYYEERSVGLDGRYHSATLQAIGKAVAAPHRFRIARPPNFRQVRLHGFPFTITYREAGATVQVLAVAHHRRRPDYWSLRA